MKTNKFLEKNCQKLSFKKRKTKGALVDDALEDTASSPVTSPKVYDLRRLDMNPEEKATDNINSKEKGRSYRQRNKRDNEVGFIGRDSDCTELEKRGPLLSSFVHELILAKYMSNEEPSSLTYNHSNTYFPVRLKYDYINIGLKIV